jgi:multidrug efflux pump subunit AcrA (membrane-fusion protein)
MYIAGGICLVLLACMVYIYTGQTGKKDKVNMEKGNPLVEVYKVERADMMRHIALSGQTVADAHITLAPKYSGRITAVQAKLGDHVKAGDVLMVQDTGDLDWSIRQNQAAAQAAAADAVEAEATYNANYIKTQNAYEIERMKYERNAYLFSIGAISQETLDSVKEEYMTSKAAYEALDNQSDGSSMPASVASKQYTADKNSYAAKGLEKQREDMYLIAPRDGVIGYRAAEVGALAAAGTKVFELVDNSHVYVDCSLSENDAAVLETGMDVDVTIDALGQSYTGKLVYVSPAMDDSAKTYTVRISLDEDKSAIKAGLFARSQIDILQRPQTLFVPKEAVINKNGRVTVFVVRPDQTVEERDVRIGLLNDTQEEIISGLADGDVVALSNQDRLKDGMTVDTTEAAS